MRAGRRRHLALRDVGDRVMEAMGRIYAFGKPRKVTDAQVEIILAWHAKDQVLRARRRQIKTKGRFAHDLGVATSTLDRIVARGANYRIPLPADRPRGRVPKICDETTRALVRAWFAEDAALRRLRKKVRTRQQIADELGLSTTAVAAVVAKNGVYKLPSPEKRERELAIRRQRIARMRERYLI
jgi:transposase